VDVSFVPSVEAGPSLLASGEVASSVPVTKLEKLSVQEAAPRDSAARSDAITSRAKVFFTANLGGR
jgi:hypothetical protein